MRPGPAWLLALTMVGACKDNRAGSPSPAPSAAPTAVKVETGPGSASPLSLETLATTAGSIAIGNLDSQIRGIQRSLERNPNDVALHLGLVDTLLERGSIRGRVADYEAAIAVAERAVTLDARGPSGLLARARARGRLHRFDEALADLTAAAHRGAPANELEGQRAAIAAARGRHQEAHTARQRLASANRDFSTVAMLAVATAQLERPDEAEKLFVEAQGLMNEAAPFSLVWLYFQQGLMWQEFGSPARAQALFENAHGRLPEHAQVAAHLAALVERRKGPAAAIEILRPIVEAADDPELGAQLGQLLERTGQAEEGRRLLAAAHRRYDELLERHPAAFASHGARFFLGPGRDVKRAVALARVHREAQPDTSADLLLLEALAASGDTRAACDHAERALGAQPHRQALDVAAANAFIACGQRERGASLLAGKR